MKLHNYIILLYFLFFFKFLAFSQFERVIIHQAHINSSVLVLETSTNDYIIVVEDLYTGDDIFNGCQTLFKISQNGELIDSIYLSGINFYGDFININNDEILLTGSLTKEFQDTLLMKPILLKMDEELNIISIDTLDLPFWFPIDTSTFFPSGLSCRKILPTKTGDFLALTMYTPGNYVIYELNPDFDTIQTVNFNLDFHLPHFLNNNNDSSFYAFSNSEIYKINKNNFAFTFIKDLESAVDEDVIRRLASVKYLSNNRILTYFSCDILLNLYPFEDDEQLGIYITDTLFNLQNYAHISYSTDTLDMPVLRGSGIDFTDPDNIFVVSVINHPIIFPEEEISSIMVSVLDSNLNIKNQTFYGGDDRYLPCDIKATSDGGCLIVSGKYEINSGNNYSHVHLLKVNENGELNPQISNEEINNSTMKLAFIYPNPSKDFINVRYGAHLKNVSIEIFDISGKKIFHKNLKNPISKIDIQNLKSGSYVYHILNDNKIIEKEILIKK